MAEKRVSERRRALRTGKIVLNKGGWVIDCTVRNISKTGALLGVLCVATVPEEFELRWDGNVQRCAVGSLRSRPAASTKSVSRRP
jgi:hypothetical protein